MCHSPQLFAAYHVFHRLLVPRHPPCALGAFLALWPLWPQPSSNDDRYSVTDHLHFCLNLLGFHSKISDVFLLFFVRYSVFGFQGAKFGQFCEPTGVPGFHRLSDPVLDSAFFIKPSSGSNGDGEIRTHDPLLARQVLSQLSYTPDEIFSDITYMSYMSLHPIHKISYFFQASGSHLFSHTVANAVPSAA